MVPVELDYTKLNYPVGLPKDVFPGEDRWSPEHRADWHDAFRRAADLMEGYIRQSHVIFPVLVAANTRFRDVFVFTLVTLESIFVVPAHACVGDIGNTEIHILFGALDSSRRFR